MLLIILGLSDAKMAVLGGMPRLTTPSPDARHDQLLFIMFRAMMSA